ncbi:hypothetical protein Ocin01_04728 [Orchesella cincta]|uniref:Transmembrane protein n=1 Tax=Orchesella cincta TaxID=48709 RepID=A0A1D2N9N4_ORCCI|nr:hypothetical protein Ocin01_04728 [Orchesella cincta]
MGWAWFTKSVEKTGRWLNFRYIGSPVGMLKIVTLFTLVCSGFALLNGHCNAEYISPAWDDKISPEQRCNAGPKRPIDPVSGKQVWCPQIGLAHASIVFIGVPFVASLILLIVQLFVRFDLSMFTFLHIVGHVIAGLLVMIGAVLCLAFAVEGFNYYQCNDAQCGLPTKNTKLCKGYQEISTCLELRTSYLQPFSFVVAGTFALVGGGAYIVTGVAIKQYGKPKTQQYLRL